MDQTHIYRLDPKKRILHSPLPLMEIGWMPHHFCIHQNNRIEDLFICISSNQESCSETMVNGILRKSMPNPLPHLSFVLPGTLFNTISPSYHDELFFHYPADCLPVFCDLFGQEIVQKKGFSFPGVPESTVAAIKQELEHYDEPAVPDLLDQLAVQLITRIFIQHQQKHQSDKSLHLKLHSIASELAQGKNLSSVLKRYSISERSFYREWNKAFSLSPKEYVQQYRLKSVCDLLIKTDLSISEISGKCGFSSSAYLYQIFQKKIGMSPKQFRQKKQELIPDQ